jgi:hypothetical protein
VVPRVGGGILICGKVAEEVGAAIERRGQSDAWSVYCVTTVRVYAKYIQCKGKRRDIPLMAGVGRWLEELDWPVPRPSGRPAWPRGL